MGRYAQFRAPQEGEALVEPGWQRQLELAEENRQSLRALGEALAIGGISLKELSAQGRRDLVANALTHTRQYAEAVTPSVEGPIFVSGHQPDLFHPGVWFKNFALDSLAKAAGGVGIHLLIDSDLCRNVAVCTPAGSIEEPRVETIPFDTPAGAMPYEERQVQEESLFRSFADRVSPTITPLITKPLIAELWPPAIGALDWTRRLGETLSAARHSLERNGGSTTLEVPLSVVCDTTPFRHFVAELLGRPDQFRGAYNGALAEYRKAHHLRNAAQPLPNLIEREGWIETPFWVWSETKVTRRPLWAQRKGSEVALSDGADWQALLQADPDGQFAGDAVQQLAQLRDTGVKIRSRALTTTLYSRMVLADLFLHGIGGAKYDQVTDRIAEKFFGIAPPPHATLSATLRLPLGHLPVSEADRRQVLSQLREQRFHPERFLEGPLADLPPEVRFWIDQKRTAIALPQTPKNAVERHAAIDQANRELQPWLADQRMALERQRVEIEKRLRAASLLDSREYAFCLFPTEWLRKQLMALARFH